jgi:hypothetical protein
MTLFKSTLIVACTLTLSGCAESIEKKIISSSDNKNVITVIISENNKYIVNGEYKSDKLPSEKYILNNSSIEYFPALVRWTPEMTEIYSLYGSFKTNSTGQRLKHFAISTSEFERLKRDSLNYKYFYY